MDIDRSPSPPHSQEYRLSTSNDILDLPLSFHQQLRLETPIDNHNHRHAKVEMRYTTPHKSEYTISQRSTSQQSTLSRREEIPHTKWTARKWTEMVPRTTREETDDEDTEQWESTIDQEYEKENIHSNQYQTPKRTHRTARGNKVELTPQTAFLKRHEIIWEPRRLFSRQSQRPRVEDSFTEMPSSHTRERNIRPSKRWSVWTQLPAIITMFGLSLIQDPITKIALSQFLVGLYDPAYQNEPFHTELQTGAGQSFTAFLNMLNRYTSVISSPPVSYFDHQHIVINGIALQWQEILRTLLFTFAVHYASRQLGRSLSTSSNPRTRLAMTVLSEYLLTFCSAVTLLWCLVLRKDQLALPLLTAVGIQLLPTWTRRALHATSVICMFYAGEWMYDSSRFSKVYIASFSSNILCLDVNNLLNAIVAIDTVRNRR